MSARWLVVAAGVCVAAPALAQERLADRIASAPDGRVRLTFAARPGVCGDGEHVWTQSRREANWDIECEPGPVHVVMTTEAGRVQRIRVYVGGRWGAPSAPVTDLGRVAAPDAAAFFLELARSARDDVARRAIWPATLADSATVWPALLDLAADEGRGMPVRRMAMQHVGMAAAEAIPDDGATAWSDDERDLREQAVFALSQLPREESVPMLLDIARGHRDAGIRRRAVFWLGQSGDPRVIPLFEEILRP